MKDAPLYSAQEFKRQRELACLKVEEIAELYGVATRVVLRWEDPAIPLAPTQAEWFQLLSDCERVAETAWDPFNRRIGCAILDQAAIRVFLCQETRETRSHSQAL